MQFGNPLIHPRGAGGEWQDAVKVSLPVVGSESEQVRMRELTSHKVSGLNEALTIHVMDEPGQGNACHVYGISFVDGKPEDADDDRAPSGPLIQFQNGPIQEVGVNGISGEALLAIVEDRLLGFQSGEYACRENAVALTKIQEAMMWLQKRTLERIKRGVEGTHQK